MPVDSQSDLIPVLAESMAAEKGGGAKDYLTSAESQIVSNKTTALTTAVDRYCGTAASTAFDELHELIHICTCQGGLSTLKAWSHNFNEGAVNYFAKLTANNASVSVTPRYEIETGHIERLLSLAEKGKLKDEATVELFKMCFQNKELKTPSESKDTAEQNRLRIEQVKSEPFWMIMGRSVCKLDKWPSGKALGFELNKAKKDGCPEVPAAQLWSESKSWNVNSLKALMGS